MLSRPVGFVMNSFSARVGILCVFRFPHSTTPQLAFIYQPRCRVRGPVNRHIATACNLNSSFVSEMTFLSS